MSDEVDVDRTVDGHDKHRPMQYTHTCVECARQAEAASGCI